MAIKVKMLKDIRIIISTIFIPHLYKQKKEKKIKAYERMDLKQ